MIYYVSVERIQESCSKKEKRKKRMQESWFERGKEEGSTVLEKVRARDVGLRTLGFFFSFFNIILI